MSTADISESTAASSEPQLNLLGPGSRLRLARENAKLSQADVAQKLCLRTKVINDIENDEYSDAPKFVFIRGYLRSYAKFIDLSGDDIVDAFNGLNLEENISDRPVWDINQQLLAVKKHNVRWLTYLIPLVLLILMGMWWHSQKSSFDESKTGLLPIVENTAQDNMVSDKLIQRPNKRTTESPRLREQTS